MENRPHKHHALQIAWAAPGTEVVLHTDEGALRGAVVVVEGGVTHALELERGVMALVDAASARAGALRDQHLAGRKAAVVAVPVGDGSIEVLRGSLPESGPGVGDPRIRAVLDWLDTLERERRWSTVSLDGALGLVHLSRSRFLHLFSAQVGTPWRTYLVWRRALVAMTLAQRLPDLTAAAHLAGYADSAHLSRQFAALFGVTPSEVLQNSHFVQS